MLYRVGNRVFHKNKMKQDNRDKFAQEIHMFPQIFVEKHL